MSPFEPCPGCRRHVATLETVCPFCATPLPDSFRETERAPLRGRMSRVAVFAAGATATVFTACFTGGSAYGVCVCSYDAGTASDGPAGTGGAAAGDDGGADDGATGGGGAPGGAGAGGR
jgi:hypothetical protein